MPYSTGSFAGIPVLTWGWTASAGLRVPLKHDVSPRSTPPSILFGFGFRGAVFDEGWDVFNQFSYRDGRRKEVYFYGSIGFEYVITPKRMR